MINQVDGITNIQNNLIKMKQVVKNFSQFVNEAKFYHALPQGLTRLRDQYRELSAGEQEEIQDLAKELDEFNILSEFKKGLSRYNTIAEVKKKMQEAVEAGKSNARELEEYNAMSAEEKEEYRASQSGWSIRKPSIGGESRRSKESGRSNGGYYYGRDKE